jgi:hypothetical protein
MRSIGILLSLLLLPGQAVAKTPGCGEDSTVGDYSPDLVKPASEFLAALQRAVAANDRKVVAGMVHYPVRVNGVKGQRAVSSSPDDFVRRYSAILTPHVRDAIAAQRTACLFANWQGIMIGKGEVRFDREPEGMRIITFNVR